MSDNWKHRSIGMKCSSCMWYVAKRIMADVDINETGTAAVSKEGRLGRCRRHAPSANGFVPVFDTDWCGDHRMDESKV